MYDMELINTTMENLRKNNMSAVFVKNKNELLQILPNYIRDDDKIAFGGSMTLTQAGIMGFLKEMEQQGKIKLFDRNREDITKEEVDSIYRETFFCDTYFTSSNAITQYGYLYNVDGNGNRVAAMIFGPKNVVVVVGCNKLVASKEEAIERVKKVAAPKNAARLHVKTPCAITGECQNCMSDDRICCSYTFFGKQRINGRIKVIIVGEELGY